MKYREAAAMSPPNSRHAVKGSTSQTAPAVTIRTSRAAGRKAPGPASVELSQVDGAAAAYLLQERTGDQVARQDEENVHPDETPAETGDSGVIEQHEKDRDRSHSLDVWPEAGRTMSTHELT